MIYRKSQVKATLFFYMLEYIWKAVNYIFISNTAIISSINFSTSNVYICYNTIYKSINQPHRISIFSANVYLKFNLLYLKNNKTINGYHLNTYNHYITYIICFYLMAFTSLLLYFCKDLLISNKCINTMMQFNHSKKRFVSKFL